MAMGSAIGAVDIGGAGALARMMARARVTTYTATAFADGGSVAF